MQYKYLLECVIATMNRFQCFLIHPNKTNIKRKTCESNICFLLAFSLCVPKLNETHFTPKNGLNSWLIDWAFCQLQLLQCANTLPLSPTPGNHAFISCNKASSVCFYQYTQDISVTSFF